MFNRWILFLDTQTGLIKTVLFQ